MAIWPFGRKSNRKDSVGGPGTSSADTAMRNDLGYNGRELSNTGPERRRSGRDKKRKSSRDSKKLQRDPQRAYSFSPGRDTIRVARDENPPPVPPIPIDIQGKAVRAQTGFPDLSKGPERILRASTQPQEPSQWERMPTLHKKSPQESSRRKSSKRRKEDHDREVEIKAMAAFMPNRPAADLLSSGRSIQKENKRMRHGLSSSNKSSEISLPLSVHSSLSGSDNPASYKVSGLDYLSPRPTIKYEDIPKYIPPANGSGLGRAGSKKRKVSERVSIPEETLKANKRIEDLADDMNAGELRELMERDQKRREKKKIADRIRMEQRLARRQAKQKAEEASAARDGTPPPANMSRGVFGRDVVGLGIGTSAIVTSSKRKNSAGAENGRGKRPGDHFRRESTASSVHSPFVDDAENPTPTSERSMAVIETAKIGTVARASMSPSASPRRHTRGASSISQMMDLNRSETVKPTPKPEPRATSPERVEKTITPEPRTESAAGSHSSWTSFFKRRSKIAKHGSTPSSFSNTSRDSMHQAQPGPMAGYTPIIRSTSNIPKRTMSKFREDLPELPISPPNSRVQSPEYLPPIRTEFQTRKVANRSPNDNTPISGRRSQEALQLRDETPTDGHRSIDIPSPDQAILSQSLASIDSEGSWLSGRKAGSKRGSNQMHGYKHESVNSLQRKFKEYSDSSEELGIAQDEYFSRLSPEPESGNMARRASGHPVPSSDEENGSMASPVSSEKARTKWGAVGRTPTVIHREPRAKSREGLLNDFGDDSGDESVPERTIKERRKSYGFDKSVIEEGEGLYRATSVDLGRRSHSRHISAGSARLLDLKPKRISTDSKRMSNDNQN